MFFVLDAVKVKLHNIYFRAYRFSLVL